MLPTFNSCIVSFLSFHCCSLTFCLGSLINEVCDLLCNECHMTDTFLCLFILNFYSALSLSPWFIVVFIVSQGNRSNVKIYCTSPQGNREKFNIYNYKLILYITSFFTSLKSKASLILKNIFLKTVSRIQRSIYSNILIIVLEYFDQMILSSSSGVMLFTSVIFQSHTLKTKLMFFNNVHKTFIDNFFLVLTNMQN